jgi:hypothetical protein
MMVARMRETIEKYGSLPEVAGMATELGRRLEQWDKLTLELGMAAMKNPDEAGAAATDYLQFAGYMCLGWCWLASAGVAAKQLAAGAEGADFYGAKVFTARFFFDRLLPRVDAHAAAARAGAAGLMTLPAEHFSFA